MRNNLQELGTYLQVPNLKKNKRNVKEIRVNQIKRRKKKIESRHMKIKKAKSIKKNQTFGVKLTTLLAHLVQNMSS